MLPVDQQHGPCYSLFWYETWTGINALDVHIVYRLLGVYDLWRYVFLIGIFSLRIPEGSRESAYPVCIYSTLIKPYSVLVSGSVSRENTRVVSCYLCVSYFSWMESHGAAEGWRVHTGDLQDEICAVALLSLNKALQRSVNILLEFATLGPWKKKSKSVIQKTKAKVITKLTRQTNSKTAFNNISQHIRHTPTEGLPSLNINI